MLIEANLDDLSPQLVPDAAERCFAAGALDVWVTPVQMKKGRPGLVFSALARSASERAVAEAILRETTTLGVRVTPVRRLELEREWLKVDVDGEPVRGQARSVEWRGGQRRPRARRLSRRGARERPRGQGGLGRRVGGCDRAPGGVVTGERELQDALERRIAQLDSVVVAFSGGVDSSLVAALSVRALGSRALAVTAVSPALAAGELDGAREVARAVGIRHEVIETDELANADYRRNDRFRCFHCKSQLYTRLSNVASERGFAALASGANADDAGDWRPGLRAAADHGVVHPLLELGVGKQAVRALAARLGVPSARKPASPCLASRIPYGVPVERETLAQIDRAERAVAALGYRVFRVRHHGALGRLALDAPELSVVESEPQRRAALEHAIRSAGYAAAEIDADAFRSGALNDVLTPAAQEP